MKAHLIVYCPYLARLYQLLSSDEPPEQPLGLFTARTDVGAVAHAGSAAYDRTAEAYTLAGAGENMWGSKDAFCYLSKRMSGDLSLAAAVQWLGTNGNPHRKACLVIRQTLAADSPYADVAVHGNGLTSLQYRETAGGPTREIQANIAGPSRVALEKRGDYVLMSIAPPNEKLQSTASFRLRFEDPFYVGLAVCAHDAQAVEKATFSKVELTDTLPPQTGSNVQSTIETISIASLDRRIVYNTRDHLEAPNWSRDGRFLLYNSNGRLYQLPVAGGNPRLVDSGSEIRCNNDHGFSPDGKHIAISGAVARGKSLIYIVSADGGTPQQVTPIGPSYWHGWSPDGKSLAYCAERNGNFDIFTIPAEGGAEKRLTTATGLDDGPDFSPDGKFVYFNSERTGLMQIWRMKADGSGEEQVTSDDSNNWFPHPSPDGKWLAFLTYGKEVTGHPENKDVMLRLMPVGGGEIKVIAKLFGGQGTINVPSWSPDSKQLAFVSYKPF